jgi:hypothetical protein
MLLDVPEKGKRAPLATGHPISFIHRIETADNRSGVVCHGAIGRLVDRLAA